MIAQNRLARRPQHDDNKGQSAEVVLGKTNLLLAFLGLLFFAVFCWLIPLLPEAFALMLLVLPVLMVTSRIWRSRRGQLEYGLMRHPLRRNLRPYLVQGPTTGFSWRCVVLLSGRVPSRSPQPSMASCSDYRCQTAYPTLHS